MYIPKLSKYNYTFPNPRKANDEGLLAWSEDLDEDRILTAYRNGIFPWYNEADGDPVLWWSPNPRLILYLDDIKISNSLKKSIKKYEVRFNTNFKAVIKNCQDARKHNTWIGEEVIKKYTNLHKKGFAHSVETYCEGELVGGLYGLIIDSVFCGESMFSLKRDASKTALVALNKRLKELNFNFIDCQIPTAHLKSMGAIEVNRDRFLDELKLALEKPRKIDGHL